LLELGDVQDGMDLTSLGKLQAIGNIANALEHLVRSKEFGRQFVIRAAGHRRLRIGL
jgi:hypothetical protein